MFRTGRLIGSMTVLALTSPLLPGPAAAWTATEVVPATRELADAAAAIEASPQLYRAVYSGTYRDGTKTGTLMFNVENDTSGGAMTGRLFIDGFAVRYSGTVTPDYTVSLSWAMNSYRGTLTGQLAPDLSTLDGNARFWAAGQHYTATIALDQQ